MNIKNEEKMLNRIKELERQLLEQEKQHKKEIQSKDNQINNITYEYDKLKSKVLNKQENIVIEKQYVENLQLQNKAYKSELDKTIKEFDQYKKEETKIKQGFLKEIDKLKLKNSRLQKQINQYNTYDDRDISGYTEDEFEELAKGYKECM